MDLQFRIQTPQGKTEATTFPDDSPVQQLIMEFVTDERMRIQPADPEEWELVAENSGDRLDPKKSLHQNRVQSGHVLTLIRRKEPQKATPGSHGDSKVLIRCENGHYYDPKKHTKCPHCSVEGIHFPSRLKMEESKGGGVTLPMGARNSPASNSSDDVVTRAARIQNLGEEIDPVVGWLVAVGGPEKGKDYRIRSENNTIGRSKDMYICISGDDAISRERHTVITFDPQSNGFYLAPGEGRGLVFLNKEAVFTHKRLEAYDQIMLGKTTLLFIPLCGDKFKWE